MDLNKVMIIGNVTRDPESRTTPQDQTVVNFSVATNMTWKDKDGAKQERAEFHNIVAWRGLAEVCQKYVAKGMKVYVEGRLQTRSWEDDKNVKRYKTEIIASDLIMLSSKKGAGDAAGPAQDVQYGNSADMPDPEAVNFDDSPF